MKDDIILAIDSKMKELMMAKVFGNDYYSEFLKRKISEQNKALRFFFLMMFRQPAMCCTRGDLVRIDKGDCIEYWFNGIPFAREVLKQSPFQYGKILRSPHLSYLLESTLPIEKQIQFFEKIPLKEFHWNGRIFKRW